MTYTPQTLTVVSIHAPHEGERRRLQQRIQRCNMVSIHAPHEGERPKQLYRSSVTAGFNPRSPRGGATRAEVVAALPVLVSIHAPHGGERLRRPET